MIKIKFDRPDVDYTQALYMSVNEAMEKYPTSTFELIAVSPGAGNPAKLAIESAKARRNAEKVLRTLVLDIQHPDVLAKPADIKKAQANEAALKAIREIRGVKPGTDLDSLIIKL